MSKTANYLYSVRREGGNTFPDNMNIIELNNVAFSWPKSNNTAIKINDLAVEQGKKVFLQGPSGSGKSTLLSLLTGINKPDSGSIKVLEKEVSSLNLAQRDTFRADHIGYIFQQFNLIPYLSVLENVVLPCRFSKARNARTINGQEEDAKELLNKLQIDMTMFNRKVTELSIGQQQRVAAARALIGAPELIIADEPSSALDNDNCQRFIELLMTECERKSSSLFFVSHDERLASQFDQCLSLHELNTAAGGKE